MSEGCESIRVEIPAAGPTEESETPVYTASRDVLVSNVVYTPSGDISGDWNRPRYAELHVGRPGEPGGRLVASISAQRSGFYLPTGVPQNAELFWSDRLRVRAGKTLHWRSQILRGHFADGIPDPGGTVEVLLEPAKTEEPSANKLAPEYWRGRTLAIEYRVNEVPPGGGTAYVGDEVGRFVEAADSGIRLEVETPQTLGIDRETYEIPYDQIMHIRLL
jgi:hypothetical protein